ncbi:unnamed protein product [Dibothriocephalus latus]|uniref:Uncharacterized protein n=1 Tax=Dibothriocephalus latus TaxID=60516 RepID=A0A3P7NIH5_DIBLA|nr:unnamed protein product [Dibothriocephalus latus]
MAAPASYNPLASPEELPSNFNNQPPARSASSWTLGPTESVAAAPSALDMQGGVISPKPTSDGSRG